VEVETRKGEKLVKHVLDGVCPDRKYYSVADLGTGRAYGLHNADIETLTRGVVERVFMVKVDDEYVRTPLPLKGAFSDRLKKLKGRLRLMAEEVPRISDEEFLAPYGGRQRQRYETALGVLRARGIQKSDSYVGTFVKGEKLDLTSKPDPVPRVIQPRGYVYNAALGPYIRPIEKKVVRLMKRLFGGHTIMKGLNAYDCGEAIADHWNQYADPCFIGLDASRFDQHVSVDALVFEHSVYAMFNNTPEFMKLLSWQLVNRGFAYCKDGKLKYTVKGARMSGDMNTGVGNCVIMCCLIWAYMDDLGFQKGEYQLVNNGDDCGLIMDKKHLGRFGGLGAWFSEMGFDMKVEEPVFELELCVFCQSQPIFDGTRWRMVRDPRIAMSKDLVSLGNLREKAVWDEYRDSISQCGMALTDGLPLCSFYRCLGRGATVRKNNRSYLNRGKTGMDYLRGKLVYEDKTVTDAARVSYYNAFGILPDLQIGLDVEFDGLDLGWQEPTLRGNTDFPSFILN